MELDDLKETRKVSIMPKEIFDPEEFLNLAKKASECRIKRLDNSMKLKLKTSRYLYTIKLDKSEGEELLDKIQCPKKEL